MKITVYLARVILVACLFLSAIPNCWAGKTIELSISENDTLTGICERYLDDPSQWPTVAKINKIRNPHQLAVGQRLIIPVEMLKGTPVDGVATFVKGKVQIWNNTDKAWRDLRMGQPVPEKSRIKTGPDGFAEITFKDGSSLFQRQDTEVGISVAREKSDTYYANKLRLKMGRIITNIRKATGKESRFEVETPSAVAVARGTEFRSVTMGRRVARFEVLEGAIRVEGMSRRVNVSGGEGTLVQKGKKPENPRKLLAAPTLVDPKSIYKNMPLRLKFQTVAGAKAVRVIIARDIDCKDVVREEVINPADSFEMTSIPDGEYYVAVMARDGDGMEGLSLASPLKIRANPFPPMVQIPKEMAEYGGSKIETAWLDVRDASSYRIQIAEDRDFTRIVEDRADITSAGYKVKSPNPGKYFFRVCSVSSAGYEGGWSDPIGFTILPVPPAPSIDQPQIGSKELSLRWQDLGEGVSYRFQMARDEDFAEIIVDRKTEKPAIIVPRPTDTGTYYIRVGGIDKKGFQGDFSPPQSIDVRQKPYIPLVAIGVGLMLLLF